MISVKYPRNSTERLLSAAHVQSPLIRTYTKIDVVWKKLSLCNNNSVLVQTLKIAIYSSFPRSLIEQQLPLAHAQLSMVLHGHVKNNNFNKLGDYYFVFIITKNRNL